MLISTAATSKLDTLLDSSCRQQLINREQSPL
jgi:hypothetical protein